MAVIRDYIDGQFRDDEAVEVVGIGGFKTAAKISEKIAKTRDVPTTFLEDGTNAGDHIIRNPLTISIEGAVTNVQGGAVSENILSRQPSPSLGLITQFVPLRTPPQLSKITAIAIDAAALIKRIDRATQELQRPAGEIGYTGKEGKTNVERFIDFVDSVYSSDALIKIDAPFRTYSNMAITSVQYTRDNTTDSLTFTIEAQQFRFIKTRFVAVAANPAAALNGQTDGEADKGAQEGEEVEQSALTSIVGRITQ